MDRLTEFKKNLMPGKVYRRVELAMWSNAVDRHLYQVVKDGTLQKVAPGVYYYPKTSTFGEVPPDENELVRSFLKDDRFLLVSPNFYNSLGVGTTQLYNKKVVYNHKRHGKFRLGNRDFEFQIKHHFPSRITEEFLLVDLFNNLDHLEEDHDAVLQKLLDKASRMSSKKLKQAVLKYANAKAKKVFGSLFNKK
jgi:hypothetical protein